MDIKELIQSGEVVEHADGSMRWASGNSHDMTPGSFAEKHPMAKSDFNAQSGAMARQSQIEAVRVADRHGYMIAVEKRFGFEPGTLTLLEARVLDTEDLILRRFEEEKSGDVVKLSRHVDERMGLSPKKHPLIDARQVNIDMTPGDINILVENFLRDGGFPGKIKLEDMPDWFIDLTKTRREELENEL